MNLSDYLIKPQLTFAEVIETINFRATQILLVTDGAGRLLGTVTDGDIRRGLLKQLDGETPVQNLMNTAPIIASADWSPQQAQSLMQVNRVHHIPVVDAHGKVVGIFTSETLLSREQLPNVAIVMVGGMGARLGEMTKHCPKPMLKIGGKPILQTIIEVLKDAGISRIVLAVNYLAAQIEEYFGDGDWLGVHLSYCFESKPLGTAGALRLIKIDTNDPLLVMNGDILTRLNFGHLLRYHAESHAAATMCVRLFSHQIPFGVVEIQGNRILGIQEKPNANVLVNSGIYVLNPEVLSLIPPEGRFDMPSLFEILNKRGKAAVAYPIQEYWTDIGQLADFREAEKHFTENFQVT